MRTRFEHAEPILTVTAMDASIEYYVTVLGFANADWGGRDFTQVRRDGAGIYLCQRAQGHPGSWAWVGVEDVESLYQEYRRSGARIRHPPRNYPWALELHVEDLDGNVLRFGSEPLTAQPYQAFEE